MGRVTPVRTTRSGAKDSLGEQCSGCGHSNNWHQPGDLCVVKVEPGSDKRCGCTYVSPNAEQASTATRPQSAETGRRGCGARRELGGQQPCPLTTPCDERTCRIGSADGSETYKPDTAPKATPDGERRD